MLRKRSLIFALSFLMAAGFAMGCGEDNPGPDTPGSTDGPGDDKPEPGDDKPGENDKPGEDGKEVLKDAVFSTLVSGDLVTNESGGTASFEVKLDENPGRSISIDIRSSNEKEGIVSPGALQFDENNWETPQTVTITGVADNAIDGDQDYKVIIEYRNETKPSSDSSPSVVKEVTVVNQDANLPELTLSSVEGLEVSESGEQASVSIALGVKPTSDVKLGISSENADEVEVLNAELTFTPDNWAEEQTLTLKGVDDYVLDGDQEVLVKVEVLDGDSAFKAMEAKTFTVTNHDNDVAGITLISSGELKTDETGSIASFSVALSAIPTSEVKLSVSSDNTAEGIVNTSELVFTPEDWNSPQVITVTGVSDNAYDGNQEYNVVIGESITSEDLVFAAVKPISVKIINEDTTSTGVTVTPLEVITNEDGGSAEISVVLTGAPTSSVHFTISGLDEVEGTIDKTELEFTTENWNEPQIIKVTGLDDSSMDGNKVYELELSPAESDDSNYNEKYGTKIKVTNVDTDTPGISLIAPELLESVEGGENATFSLVLNTQPTGQVSINFSAMIDQKTPCSDVAFYLKNGENLELMTTSRVTFTQSNWNVPQEVVIKSVEDRIIDADIDYKVVFSPSLAADKDYTNKTLPEILGVSRNSDGPGLLVNTGGLDVVTDESGKDFTFYVSLLSKPKSKVVVHLTSDENEGKLSSKKLEIASVSWNKPLKVVVKGVDDEIVDGDIEHFIEGTFESADANYNEVAFEPIKVVNKDNDEPEILVSQKGIMLFDGHKSQKVTVSLAKAPTHPISFDVSVPEADEAYVQTDVDVIEFTPEDWNKPKEITISARQITASERLAKVILEPVKSESAVFNGLDPDDITVNISFATLNFDYTGEVQSTTLKPGVYKLEVWGAQGGNSTSSSWPGGKGGYTTGVLTLNEETKIFVYVGGSGTNTYKNIGTLSSVYGGSSYTSTWSSDSSVYLAEGGFNGGGSVQSVYYNYQYHGSGGGATDIRLVEDSFYHRVIVAGGGGGGNSYYGYSGRFGGGSSGDGDFGYSDGEVYSSGYYNSGPGTQTAGGNLYLYSTYDYENFTKKVGESRAGGFGVGASYYGFYYYYYLSGGGGGGWYGGGASVYGGGAGGSGYALTKASAKPEGYALGEKYYLTQSKLTPGNQSIISPTGISETGHSNHGYARISAAIP